MSRQANRGIFFIIGPRGPGRLLSGEGHPSRPIKSAALGAADSSPKDMARSKEGGPEVLKEAPYSLCPKKLANLFGFALREAPGVIGSDHGRTVLREVHVHEFSHRLVQVHRHLLALGAHLGDHVVVVGHAAIGESVDEVVGVAVEFLDESDHDLTLRCGEPCRGQADGEFAEGEGGVRLLRVLLRVLDHSEAEGEVEGEGVDCRDSGGLVHGAILPVGGANVKSRSNYFCFTAEVHHTNNGILVEANPVAFLGVERGDVVRVLTAHKLGMLVLRNHDQVPRDLAVVGCGSVHLSEGDADDLSVGEGGANDTGDFLSRVHFLFLSWRGRVGGGATSLHPPSTTL